MPAMFFSTPDVGNLLFAPLNTRFVNPVWYPYFARETHVRKLDIEVPPPPLWGRGGAAPGAGDMWAFEQPVGFLNVTVNIRMTVLRLADGGLWVHDPIAPTQQLLDELAALGEVRHVVLGATAIEHKFFARAFLDKFPGASFYATPGVFNYVPFRPDLAPRGLGLFADLVRPTRIDGWLTPGFAAATLNGVEYPASEVPPWAAEIDHALLFLDTDIASLGETAFLVKGSRTLLVTDSITYIDSRATDWLTDSGRRDRSFPFNMYPEEWSPERKKAVDMMQIFTIQTPWGDGEFRDLTDRLYVCPQLRLFVFESDPRGSGGWVDTLVRWNPKQVVASHFDAPAPCSQKALRDAFSFILDRGRSPPLPGDYCMGVLKAVQILLRRTLFRKRLEEGSMQELEYMGGRGEGYKGRVELPLLGEVSV